MTFDLGAISTDAADCPDYVIDPQLLKELRDQILVGSDGKIKKSHLRLKQLAFDVADILNKSTRFGTLVDAPEGARYIVLSDTVARALATVLRNVAMAND